MPRNLHCVIKTKYVCVCVCVHVCICVCYKLKWGCELITSSHSVSMKCPTKKHPGYCYFLFFPLLFNSSYFYWICLDILFITSWSGYLFLSIFSFLSFLTYVSKTINFPYMYNLPTLTNFDMNFLYYQFKIFSSFLYQFFNSCII